MSGPPRAVTAFPHPFQYTFLKHTHDLMVDDTTMFPLGTPSNVFEMQQKQKSWRRNTSRISHPYITHKYIQSYSPLPNRRQSPHINPPLTIHTASFSCPNRRRSPHIHIPLTIHTTLFSATQPRSPHIRRCELLVVIVCRDHLIQNAFHPLLLLSLVGDRQMHCGITFL